MINHFRKLLTAILVIVITASISVYSADSNAFLIETDRLHVPSNTFTEELSGGSKDEIPVYHNIDELVLGLREAIVNRNVPFTYKNDFDFNITYDELYERICEHTGNPKEGDYIKGMHFGYTVSGNGDTLTFDLYNCTTARQERAVDQAVAEVLASLNLDGLSDLDKITRVYKYMSDSYTYKFGSLDQFAYDAIVLHEGVCNAFAVTFYRFMMELGIDCRYICGDVTHGEGSGSTSDDDRHAWNIVKVGDYYYYVDSTWDLEAYRGKCRWLLLSEEDFKLHTGDPEYLTEEFRNNYPIGLESQAVTPIIETRIEDKEGSQDEKVDFEAYVFGNFYSYKWLRSDDDGQTWTEATDASYYDVSNYNIYIMLGPGNDGSMYKFVVYDADGDIYYESNTATVRIPYRYWPSRWHWSDDNTSCTVTMINSDGKTFEMEADVETITHEPTCEKEGYIAITATVRYYYSWKDEIVLETIPVVDHSIYFDEFEWDEDYQWCKGHFRCEWCSLTEIVDAELTVEANANCGQWGTCFVTAYISADRAPDNQEHSETESYGGYIPHNWDTTVYDWADDNSKVTAFRTCKKCNTTESEECVTTIEVIEPNCTEEGGTRYTAEFENEAFVAQIKIIYDKPALGHNLSEWTYTITPSCTTNGEQSRKCSRCEYKETRTVAATGHKRADPVREDESEPTCTDSGSYWSVVYCEYCHERLEDPVFITVPALGHAPGESVRENEIAATCIQDGGFDETIRCSVCGEVLENTHVTIPATGHSYVAISETKEATCTQEGYVYTAQQCTVCHEIINHVYTTILPLGHNWNPWIFDGEDVKTHTHTCMNDASHVETEPCDFEVRVDGDTTYYICKVCNGSFSVKNEGPENPDIGPVTPEISGITRVYGTNRFGTSFAISEALLLNSGKEKHDVVILANGDNFADALAGSYLAAVKNAPIIITRAAEVIEANAYIKSVLNKGGTIYVLGGTAAVPDSSLKGLEGYRIKRLAGSNRYGTNIEILNAARVEGETILIATGINYADSLSASATGLPMLLVKGQDKLNEDQIKFLKDNPNKKLIILGGTSAVSSSFESELKKYGKVERIAGNNRFDTSKLIAEKFFDGATVAVLAYGSDFPDGLCGGPLANQIGAPLVLTRNDKVDIARPYTKSRNITDGYALGGTAVLPDATVRKLFGASESVKIEEIMK